MIYSQRELNAGGCEAPGCTHEDHCELVLTVVCHPSGGVKCIYYKKEGTLVMFCRVCTEPVAAIKVAEC